ncbi:MAG: hypothetical protein LBP79_02805 [Clostridiales bacterium]|nr:hypothetical protein [Clostridiales bacterium]
MRFWYWNIAIAGIFLSGGLIPYAVPLNRIMNGGEFPVSPIALLIFFGILAIGGIIYLSIKLIKSCGICTAKYANGVNGSEIYYFYRQKIVYGIGGENWFTVRTGGVKKL